MISSTPESEPEMTDLLTDLVTGRTEGEGPTFTAFFAYLKEMNAGVARVIPSDEDERPIGGIFFFRGDAEDVAILREAAESAARDLGVHVEPGEGDIPFGQSIEFARNAGFEFVVTPGEQDGDTTCSAVTTTPELTDAVAAAITAVEERWETEWDAKGDS